MSNSSKMFSQRTINSIKTIEFNQNFKNYDRLLQVRQHITFQKKKNDLLNLMPFECCVGIKLCQ